MRSQSEDNQLLRDKNRVDQAIADLREGWIESYGAAVCDLTVTPATLADSASSGPHASTMSSPDDDGAISDSETASEDPSATLQDGLKIEGWVLLANQIQIVRKLIEGLLPHREILFYHRALQDHDAGLGFVAPASAVVNILQSPQGGLSTQWCQGDLPARVLAKQGQNVVLQLADATIGWCLDQDLIAIASESHAADRSKVQEAEPTRSDGDTESNLHPDRLIQNWTSEFRGVWKDPVLGAWRWESEKWLGIPYLWGGNSKGGIDCSGLTQRILKNVADIGIPKNSRDQVRMARRIAPDELGPGDLVFLNHKERKISHVGLVLEPGENARAASAETSGEAASERSYLNLEIVNASFDAGEVVIESLGDMLARYRFRGARSFRPAQDVAGESSEIPSTPIPEKTETPARSGMGQDLESDQADASVVPLRDSEADLAAREKAWEALHAFREAKVHIVGMASTESASMLRFLWEEGIRDLTVHDFQQEDAVKAAFDLNHVGMSKPLRASIWKEMASLPIRRMLGPNYLSGVEKADAIAAGQAWYLYDANLPILEDLHEAGRPFLGMLQFYDQLSPARCMAFSGSNGKSTSSRMAETIMRQTKRKIYYAGNERRSVQVLDKLRGMQPSDWLILEVSNRHLRGDHRPRPAIGVLTNVLPNHLSEHGGSFEAYNAVKRRLIESQHEEDFAVLNLDNPATAEMGEGLAANTYFFSRVQRPDRGAWIEEGMIKASHGQGESPTDLAPISLLRLPGRHNQENALAACLAAWLAGAQPEEIRKGLGMFRGLRHRIQFVWEYRDVDYFDDLNSTTPTATLAAIEALDAPIVLIAGGDSKSLDYTSLAKAMEAKVSRLCLLPGAGSDDLAQAVSTHASKVPIDRFEDFDTLMQAVVKETDPGSKVLLSPACPYFFRRNYLRSGAKQKGFKAILRELSSVKTRKED